MKKEKPSLVSKSFIVALSIIATLVGLRATIDSKYYGRKEGEMLERNYKDIAGKIDKIYFYLIKSGK